MKVQVVPGQDNLKCILTDEEVLNYGKKQAKTLSDLQREDEELASFKTAYKNKVTMLQSTVNILSEKIRNGYEFRMVETEIHTDFDNNMVRFYRKDTGECYATRTLNAEERQQKLNFQAEEAKG